MNALLEITPAEPEIRQRPHSTLNLTLMFMLLAGCLVAGLTLHWPGLDYCPNDASRWSTVYYLVEHGTYEYLPDHGGTWPNAYHHVDISKLSPDEIAKLYKVGDKYYSQVWYFPVFPTIDMVRVDGKYYSSKPPLLPTLIAGLVWVIQKVTGVHFHDNPWFIMRTTLLLIQVVPLLVFIGLMGRHIHRVSRSPWVRCFCLSAVALGTYLTPWAVTLNNHVIAACSGFVAVYALIRIWYDQRREWYWFTLCGFFAAFTAANELPAAAFGLALFAAMLWKDWRRTLLAAALPAALPVFGSLLTNYLATGSLQPVYAGFGKPGGPYDYEGSYWPPRGTPTGVDALKEPWYLYMVNILIGHHGFFLLSPLFLISLIGLFRNLRADGRRWLAVLTLVLTVYLACFYTFYTAESRNYGGTAQGARWMFWLIPLWLLFLPSGAGWLGRWRVGRGACYAALALSVLSAGFALRQPWGASWAHLLFRHLKLIDY